MRPQKAIEIIDAYLRGDEPDFAPDLPVAIRMGKSAITQVILWREHGYPEFMPLLKGETKD